MIKRPLGKTGIGVSEIAFGGVEIGMPYGIGNTAVIPESEAISLLHSAVDAGINFFDTARLYGESEAIMGRAFKGKRDQVVLGTKCGHLLDQDGNIPSYSALKKVIEKSVRESLEALQTDYVDVFMLHQVSDEILDNEGILTVFSDLRQAGVIRATGVSTYTPQETKQAIDTGIWDVIQLPFNMMDQRQEELFPLALQEGTGMVIRSVLLKGLLSGRGKNLHPALEHVEKHIVQYSNLVEQTPWDLPMLATKFALSYQEVSSVLVGIDSLEYLHKSLQAGDGNYLDEKLLTCVKQLSYPDPDFLNLNTWDKMGWLK